jgi:D-glycero-alpha-D-manno-heptose-7-phosphate kinase
MEPQIEASAPVRVDLAGGWTDVGPYSNDFGGEVVNFAINRYVRVTGTPGSEARDFGSTFETPRGSGLGTSGALNVAMAAIMSCGEDKHPEELAEIAFQMEADGGNLCGRQDQWASARGGFNHLLFFGDSVEIMPFEPMRSARIWLRKHLLVAYSGTSRRSGDIQDSVWRAYAEGNTSVIDGLHRIRAAARPMANGLQQDRRDLVMQSFKDVCEGIDMIDTTLHDPFRGVVEPLLENGSLAAWKALGAGGGGCAALLCSPSGREDAIASIEGADWELIEWDYDDEGVRIAG